MDSEEVISLSLVDFTKQVQCMTDAQRLELSSEIDARIQRLVWQSGYVGARCAGGNDRGHLLANAKANTLTHRIRRILGFSYPKAWSITV